VQPIYLANQVNGWLLRNNLKEEWYKFAEC
jgi:hypothetical protein